jgi:hypothetical protein
MEMYDIYLQSGIISRPNLSDLSVDTLNQITQDIKVRLSEQSPGFLGFNLAAADALMLFDRLTSTGARGLVLPSSYRQSKVTIDMARSIAEQAILQKQAEKCPNVNIDVPQFLPAHSTPMWWTFGSKVEEWIQQGLAPGMIFASVDKIDGHIWEADDMEIIFESRHMLP